MNYDRIILELIDRVSTLEDEVEFLKTKISEDYDQQKSNGDATETSTETGGRDTTKYMFDGKKYGKNRLVLAIVKKYMEQFPSTSADELIGIFDKSLQGSLGVIRKLNEVKKNCSDYKTRFFVLPNEVIHTSTDDCAVCTQWGIGNIGNMITLAKQLGFQVTTIR